MRSSAASWAALACREIATEACSPARPSSQAHAWLLRGLARLPTGCRGAGLWTQALQAAAAVLQNGSSALSKAAHSVATVTAQSAAQPEQHASARTAQQHQRPEQQEQRDNQPPAQGTNALQQQSQDATSGKRRPRRRRRGGGSGNSNEQQQPTDAAGIASVGRELAAATGSWAGHSSTPSASGGSSSDVAWLLSGSSAQTLWQTGQMQAAGGGALPGMHSLVAGGAAGQVAPVGDSGQLAEAGGGVDAAKADTAADAHSGAAGDFVPAAQPTLILQDDAHPIREADISRPAWLVLSRLRAAGHEAYVVGGTIRDLLLGGTPKDYDILSSAELHQIKRLFSRSVIVGRSFPVCHVFAEGTLIEVSSFSTRADSQLIPLDASSHMIGRQKSKRWTSREGATWAAARANNAVRRDFTVNGLLYDPFSRLLFDSVGGVDDCAARRLRTICPPAESFKQDPARILRGVRLAARAGLTLDPATAAAMEAGAASVAALPAGRLQMEVANLMGYGAAGASLALTWRLGLLDMLLPQQAVYLRRHRVPRAPRGCASAAGVAAAAPAARRGGRRNLLFDLAYELDKHVHPQRPIDPSVWLALLAAPLVADACASAMRRHNQARRRLQRRSGESVATAVLAAASGGVSADHGGLDAGGGASSSSSGGGGGSGGEAFAASEQQQQKQQLEQQSVGGEGHGEGSVQAGDSQRAQQQQYQAQYAQVVSDVLDAMLQGLDSATLAALGRHAKKHGEQLQQSGGSRRQQGRRKSASPEGQEQLQEQQQQEARAASGTDADTLQAGSTASSEEEAEAASEEPRQQLLVPCVLPRAALERAAALLQLEADLRGKPELQALLHNSGWPPPAATEGQAGSGGEHSSTPGRHNDQHSLWQRLERISGEMAAGNHGHNSGSGNQPNGAPAGEQEQEPGAEQQRGDAGGKQPKKRHRQGRSLSAEERLVLGILSDPRFDYAARTALPP